MAIKINWQDLQKRIINWHEVHAVVIDWRKIRPSDWNLIMADFATAWASGNLPTWWGSLWPRLVINSNWITADYNSIAWVCYQLSSLQDATKLKITYNLKIDGLVRGGRLVGRLEYNGGDVYYDSIQHSRFGEDYITSAVTDSSQDTLMTEGTGIFKIESTIDFNNSTYSQVLTYPDSTTGTLSGTLTNNDKSQIRNAEERQIQMNYASSISSAKLEIWR